MYIIIHITLESLKDIYILITQDSQKDKGRNLYYTEFQNKNRISRPCITQDFQKDSGIEWRRPIVCHTMQVIFRKRATIYRALLRKMTYEDKASYGSSPPGICIEKDNSGHMYYTGFTER